MAMQKQASAAMVVAANGRGNRIKNPPKSLVTGHGPDAAISMNRPAVTAMNRATR
jgi:hypothetical protein